MRVIAYVPDLMDRSRFPAAAADVSFVATPEALVERAGDADLVVVDLNRRGVLEVMAGLRGVQTIGFASHVEADTIAAAKAAGVGEVLPRSRFFARIATLLR